MKSSRLLSGFVLLIFLFVTVNPACYAQTIDYLEDEGTSLWEEQKFLDVTGKEFETEDTQYIGDEEVKALEEAAVSSGIPSLDLAAALERDVQMLPDNVIYGIGTGITLGGWMALVQGDNARENVSYITVGALLGALLGVAVGNKTLFISSVDEETKAPEFQLANKTEGVTPSFAFTPTMAKFNLRINF